MKLQDIAKEIKHAKEQIFLLYAFNATGKTRLSVAYKELCRSENHKQTGVYYNAFSEDLFVWNNDIENAEENTRMRNALTHQKVYYPQMEAMVDDNKQIVREVYRALMTKYGFLIHSNN